MSYVRHFMGTGCVYLGGPYDRPTERTEAGGSRPASPQTAALDRPICQP
jgi:hypothetical protein